MLYFLFLFIQHIANSIDVPQKCIDSQPYLPPLSLKPRPKLSSLFSAWNIVNTFLTSHLDLN